MENRIKIELVVENSLVEILNDVNLIITSLGYTKQKFQEYTDYPSYAFKQERIADVNRSLKIIRELRDQIKLAIKESN